MLGLELVLGIKLVLGLELVLGFELVLGWELGCELGCELTVGFVLGIIDTLGGVLGTELGSSLGGRATTTPVNPSASSLPTISPDWVCCSTNPDAAAVFVAEGGAVTTVCTSKHDLPSIGTVVSKVQGWSIAETTMSTSLSTSRNLPCPTAAFAATAFATTAFAATASETTDVNANITCAAVVPGENAALKTAVVDGVSVGCELGCELGLELVLGFELG